MAAGGELYVLDMGERIKIDDLARTMIRLSGRQVRDEDNPDGDIEVKYIGLRQGDKMEEELLISGDTVGTKHSHILLLKEPQGLGVNELNQALDRLGEAMKGDDLAEVPNILYQLVEGYREETTASGAGNDPFRPVVATDASNPNLSGISGD